MERYFTEGYMVIAPRFLVRLRKGKKNMKLKNSIFAGLCSAALAVSIIPVSAEESDTAFCEAVPENVRILGRTVYNDDSLWLANSVSGVEFTVTGSQVTFNLSVSGDPTRIGVYLNGQLYQRGLISSKKGSVTVPLSDGENTVKLIKLSEPMQSELGIDSIETDKGASIKPTTAKERKLEFIGDSITCGYGIDLPLKDPETGKNNTFSTVSEDASKTYAYQLAEMFDADANLFAMSGCGIWCNYGGDRNHTMGKYYTKSSLNTWNSISSSGYTLIQSFDWDFAQYQPDCIVINLGTNDWSYFGSHTDETGNFEESYIDFLKTVRENNPDAKIICTLGMMGADLFRYIDNAVDSYKTETGDKEVYTLELREIDKTSEGLGVDYHPMAATNTRVAADELGPYIADVMGWNLSAMPDDGTLTHTPDDLVVGEYHEQVENEDSSSEVSSEASSASGSSEASSGSDSGSSNSNNSSSKTSSTTNPNNSNQNPTTGLAGGMAMIAVMGGAVIISKRKNN